MRAFHVLCLMLAFRSISTVPVKLYGEDWQEDRNIGIANSEWNLAPLDSGVKPSTNTTFRKSKRDVNEKEEATQFPTRHAKHRRRRRCKYHAGCSRAAGTAKQHVGPQSNLTSSDTSQEFASRNGTDLTDVNAVSERRDAVEENGQDFSQKGLADVEDDESYEHELSYFGVTDLIKDTTTSSVESSSPFFYERATSPVSEENTSRAGDSRDEVFEDSSAPSWMSANEDGEKPSAARRAPIYPPIDDQLTVHDGLATLLARLFQTLRNASAVDSQDLLKGLNFVDAVDEDPCQKWLNSNDKFERVFLGPLAQLPSCPCQYPSDIFYDDKIWDRVRERYYRWRDVSGESQRLDVYKPGAAYCVRSLLAQGSGSAAAQHCCYDRRRRLLTRGSGAGTPNFVSPEISAILHEKIDVLPWRLCKGDFSRFNKVRPPNNDNGCEANPDDEEYQRQIDSTKYY